MGPRAHAPRTLTIMWMIPLGESAPSKELS